MYNRQPVGQSFTDRMIGAARLDRPTYEDVERDQNATSQAAIVVAIAAVAAAIGGISQGAEGIIFGLVSAFLGWVVSAAFIFFVGTRLIPSRHVEADMGQVLRTTGFAQVPGFLAIVGFIPVLGAIVGLVAAIWGLVTLVIAIQSALEASVGRAIAIGLIATILAAIVLAILAAILGVDLTTV
jgi:hypothetical protein